MRQGEAEEERDTVDLRGTYTAMTRYLELYPEATRDEMIDAALEGDDVEPNVAQRLLGRRWDAKDFYGEYILHSERTGLFVVKESSAHDDTDVIVTFAAFRSSAQRLMALSLYGEGAAPTTVVQWLSPQTTPNTPERTEEPPARKEPKPEPTEPVFTVSQGARKAVPGSAERIRGLMEELPPHARPEDFIVGVDTRPNKVVQTEEGVFLAYYTTEKGKTRIGVATPQNAVTQHTSIKEQARELIVALGVTAADVQVDKDVALFFADGEDTTWRFARWRVRLALLEALRDVEPLREVDSPLPVEVDIGTKSAVVWLYDRQEFNAKDRELHVALAVPPPPDTEALRMAEHLRALGWQVFAPTSCLSGEESE